MGQEEVGRNETSQDSIKTEVQEDNSQNENLFPKSNRDYVRVKMEDMQRKIDELKEKVRSEGELLHSENSFIGSMDSKFQDSLNSLQNNLEQHTSENESGSDKSLYYSASNYSLCSTSSSDTAFNNFNKFVNNFVKNQNPKERLSLLQLHSKKQISLNMMKHSLTELDTRCEEELELIERSLRHLNRLAREFNVNNTSDDEYEDGKIKALEFNSLDDGDSKKLKVRSNPVLIWPHEERKSIANGYSQVFFDINEQDKSSVKE